MIEFRALLPNIVLTINMELASGEKAILTA